VAVPIVPRRIGEIELQVSSIVYIKLGESYTSNPGDAVKRKLLVVVCIFIFCFESLAHSSGLKKGKLEHTFHG